MSKKDIQTMIRIGESLESLAYDDETSARFLSKYIKKLQKENEELKKENKDLKKKNRVLLKKVR